MLGLGCVYAEQDKYDMHEVCCMVTPPQFHPTVPPTISPLDVILCVGRPISPPLPSFPLGRC